MNGAVPLVMAALYGNAWTVVLLYGCVLALDEGLDLEDLKPLFEYLKSHDYAAGMPSVHTMCHHIDSYQKNKMKLFMMSSLDSA